EEKTQTLEFKALQEHKDSLQKFIVAQQSMQKQMQEFKGQATMIETAVNSMTDLLGASADAALGPAAQVQAA
ncbi:unnamed protein product, partial [Prorocentrum cordatum]